MKRFVLPCLLAVLLTSCEKEIEFRYHDIEPQLVIEGTLTADGSRVGLTLTTPMDEPMDRTPLTDARVSVTDLTAGVAVSLRQDAEGFYTDAMPGVEGHEYRLDVERAGRTYSAVSLMRAAVAIRGLEFQWIKMPYDHVAVLKVDFTDLPGDGDRYWIRLYRNGEPYKWLQADDLSASPDGTVSAVTMTSRSDTDEADDEDVLYDGDVVGVTVTAVSREFADYLTALQADSNGPRMFEGSFCLGYFLAATPAASSIIFRPSEIKGRAIYED